VCRGRFCMQQQNTNAFQTDGRAKQRKSRRTLGDDGERGAVEHRVAARQPHELFEVLRLRWLFSEGAWVIERDRPHLQHA
jgi:hypothetical protein